MKNVLLVFPNAWDRKQLVHCRSRWEKRYQVELAEPTDEDCPWDYDVLSFIEKTIEACRGRIDGVTSSSDYPGATAASAIASRLGLPGSQPEAVIRCSHKYYSRLAQREVVPEATANFTLIDPNNYHQALERIGYPCYIKPVKGAFSIMTRRIASAAELEAFLAQAEVQEFLRYYVDMFNRLLGGLTRFEIDGSYFLAEELLHGQQATVEGVSIDGEVHLLGIVDSVKHDKTGSFVRFDYPSSLAPEIQERMAHLARQVIRHLGLTHSLFNIEMIFDEARDRVSIVEVNPRLCGQFADLYQKVDGTHGYEVALDVATGESPALAHRRGEFQVAASFPLRVFEPVRVAYAPGPGRIAEVEQRFPGTLVWSECETGQALTDFVSGEDGASYRYAIVNVGAKSRESLVPRFQEICQHLRFELDPLGGHPNLPLAL